MPNDIEMLRALSGMLSSNENTLPNDPRELKKALTTAAGFLGIQLVPQAKLMLPRFAGLRNRLPTSADTMGAASSQWRAQLGYGAFDFAAAFGTANGAVGSDTVESATTFAADYKTQAIKGGVQWEAIRQAQGWDSAMAIDTKVALSVLLLLEELEVLYASEAAIVMTTVTASYSTVHAKAGPIFSNATWGFKVTAVTGIGTKASATSNSTNGESLPSVEATVAVGASGADYIDLSWPYVPGALGYKVYANPTANSGTWFLLDPNTLLAYPKLTAGSYTGGLGDPIVVPTGQTYVTVNHVQVLGPSISAVAPPVADHSANANVFEGIASWCLKNTIYGTVLPFRNVIDQGGLPLTTQSTGIAEFDSILQTQWVTNQISPTVIITSTNGVRSVGNRIAAAGNNSQIRLDVYGNRNNIVGGLYIGGYVNKYASAMAGMQTTVDLWAHPYMPDGTFLFLSEDLPPETYPYTGVGKSFDLDVATPYTQFPLASTDRSFPYSLFYNETLRCFWPNSQAAIVGVRMDS